MKEYCILNNSLVVNMGSTGSIFKIYVEHKNTFENQIALGKLYIQFQRKPKRYKLNRMPLKKKISLHMS